MFLHKYALAIGWPVPLLKKIMSTKDIAEAMAYERIQPFGDERADYRSAIVAYTVAKYNGSKNAKISDFIPIFGKKKREDLSEKIKEVFGIGNNS